MPPKFSLVSILTFSKTRYHSLDHYSIIADFLHPASRLSLISTTASSIIGSFLHKLFLNIIRNPNMPGSILNLSSVPCTKCSPLLLVLFYEEIVEKCKTVTKFVIFFSSSHSRLISVRLTLSPNLENLDDMQNKTYVFNSIEVGRLEWSWSYQDEMPPNVSNAFNTAFPLKR